MALGFVNSNGTNGTVNVSIALAGTTAGNGLIIFLGAAAGTITGGAITGETVTAMGTKSNDPTLSIDFHGWVVNQLATGGTKTFTATVSGDFSVGILEFSGQDTTNFFVSGSGAFAAGSGGSQTVNVTTTATGQAVIGFGDLHSGVPTAGAGYTFPATNMGTFTNENFRAQYDTDLSSSVGTVAFPMGNTGALFWGIKGYAFAAGAGAPPAGLMGAILM